jgi:hypothetical protein
VLSYVADAVVGGPVGGVGQRVLSGVAKKTAGEFFQAVDAILLERLTGATTPAAADANPTAGAANGLAPAPDASVFRRPDSVTGSVDGGIHLDMRSQLAGAIVGAAIALAGVWLGWRISRR